MKTIKIKNAKFIIDDEDFELVNQYMWRLHPQGYIHGYLKGIMPRKDIRLHRLVTNAKKGYEIDHINLDKLDNRKQNLRECTRQQNMANQPPFCTNTSGYKGVSRQHGKWQSSIRIQGRLLYLGRYVSKEEAAHAYNQAAEQVFGEFARLNPIGGY